MLKDLFESIVSFANKANATKSIKDTVQFTEVPGDQQYIVTTVDDEMGITHEWRDKESPWRNHSLESVGDIQKLVEAMQLRVEDADPVVWIGQGRVTIILDDKGIRRHRVRCEQHYTEEFSLLSKLREKEFSQRDLLRLLRVDLASAATESSEVLRKAAKVINSRVLSTTHGTVVKNRESMGREIDSEVISADGDIPDTVQFRCEVFDDPAFRKIYTFTVRVELDPKEVTFHLLPLVRELRDAENEQRQHIQSLLSSLTCPVFLGEPDFNQEI